MIYEAKAGEHIEHSACEAVKNGCSTFVHNDTLYLVQPIKYDEIGHLDRYSDLRIGPVKEGSDA